MGSKFRFVVKGTHSKKEKSTKNSVASLPEWILWLKCQTFIVRYKVMGQPRYGKVGHPNSLHKPTSSFHIPRMWWPLVLHQRISQQMVYTHSFEKSNIGFEIYTNHVAKQQRLAKKPHKKQLQILPTLGSTN